MNTWYSTVAWSRSSKTASKVGIFYMVVLFAVILAAAGATWSK
jgi:hypothetical protein